MEKGRGTPVWQQKVFLTHHAVHQAGLRHWEPVPTRYFVLLLLLLLL
jgi:hypothetical protein